MLNFIQQDLPVIMMSADESKYVVMKSITHGACDYLVKPICIETLKNIWQHVVHKKKQDRKEIELEDADKKDEAEEMDDTSTLKKPRVVWSVELHQQFVKAVNQLEIDKAVPKKILELMNASGLTRENVASHLQKYRLYLRRISGVSQQQNGFNTASGQIPPQSFAAIQAAALGRVANKSNKKIKRY